MRRDASPIDTCVSLLTSRLETNDTKNIHINRLQYRTRILAGISIRVLITSTIIILIRADSIPLNATT